MGRYSILLADDHALIREGLKKIIEGIADLEVTGEAGDGMELLSLLNTLTPDMVILDISMPKLRGIEAIHEIKTKHPDTKVLVLTMHKDERYLHEAVCAGADGYLLKEDLYTELFSAVTKIRRGRMYLSPHFSEGLEYDWAQICRGVKPPFERTLLTTREREILKLVAEGKSSKEMADLLFISVHTVHRHRANIMNKLKLKKTADLVKYALDKGYV